MRALSGTLQSYNTAPGGRKFRVLFWITAKDRSTGNPITFGFWNGEDDRNFTIDAVSRLYYGAGNLALPEPVIYSVGLRVSTYTLDLSPLSPEVQAALRTYDARLAPVEIHRAALDPQSDTLIEEPMRILKGIVEEAPIGTPEVGGEATMQVRISTSAVQLTKRLTQTKSDATQSLRSGDRFARYIDVSGQVPVSWGV